MQVELRPVAELKPYPQNARTHTRKQIKKLARALSEIGFGAPLIVDENFVILAGHARLAGRGAHKLVAEFSESMHEGRDDASSCQPGQSLEGSIGRCVRRCSLRLSCHLQ